MRCCIDRWEENFAVLQDENGDCGTVPRSLIPNGCKEGDWGELTEAGFVPDPAQTAARRKQNTDLLQKLLDRSK